MANKIQYKVLDHHKHVLERPDMYIGSTKPEKVRDYVANISSEEVKVEKKEIITIPGLVRIFIEILSNAIDNKFRSDKAGIKATTIKIKIDGDKISILNNGLSIPIEINKDTGLYNPEVIFGILLSSSNYDDTQTRTWIGRNGIGSKACNIFSSYFGVKILDVTNHKLYTQEWKNNMFERSNPKIRASQLKNGYTCVEWIADFKRFGIKGYTPDILSLYQKYILDCAMLTGINIFYNDIKIPIKKLSDYAYLFSPNFNEGETYNTCFNNKDEKVEVSILGIERGGEIISYVNGVNTTDGGSHVESFYDALFRPLASKLSSKEKTLTIKDIKPYFMVFINCTLKNPEFTSQTKTKLSHPTPSFPFPASLITKIKKWAFAERLKQAKDIKILKTLEKKGKKFQKIDGFDPANKAGGRYSLDCSLILCEGLSAKTFAVKGIEIGIGDKKGRDWFGIYPLRGKVMNVRNCTSMSISKNREVTDIIKILGLKFGTNYLLEENYNTLNYGKVILLTDSDVDGYHISGLIINMFHSLFPSLIERRNFLLSVITPIIRISLRSEILEFYDFKQSEDYISANKVSKVKYYKGLGTSTDEEIKACFGKNLLDFRHDKTTNHTVEKIFSKKLADERKKWIEDWNPNNPSITSRIEPISNKKNVKPRTFPVTISEFLDKEMIKFSVEDCKRSIPSLCDGLKESQRKILYSCFLKNLKYKGQTLKVIQLGGFVAEKTNYHHGESCLFDTIIGMSQEFCGSNNIALLYPEGQFGSRLEGGKDSASPRYLFTKLNKLTRYLYRKEDDSLLERVIDDGDLVEPKYYLPILPTILINGCSAGIGTGYSCFIPCFNPLEIANLVRGWINEEYILSKNNDMVFSSFPEISPWYNNFKGKVVKIATNKYITTGIKEITKTGFQVTELPVGMWTNKFKDILEDMRENKIIKDLRNYSSTDEVNFEVVTEGDKNISNESLKLISKLSLNNMVLFNSEGKIQRYSCIDEIIDDFCKVRYEQYVKRKKHMIAEEEGKLPELEGKYRFLLEVIEGKIVISNVPEEDIILALEKGNHIKIEDSYDYLFKIPVRSFTRQKLEELRKEIERVKERIKTIKETPEEDMWLAEIKEFEDAYLSN